MLEKELSEQEIISLLENASGLGEIKGIRTAIIEVMKRMFEGKIPPETAQAYLLGCQDSVQILLHKEK